MKVAALDLGSNTFLCLIAEVENQQITKIYSDQVEVVRLGQGLSAAKNFHPEALTRADTCLEKFQKTILKHRPEKILAMATSAARDAENQEKLFEIGSKYSIPIEIIPGEKEAAITYQGATSGLKSQNKNLMVLDIGGGSTEFIFGHDLQLTKGESFNIGCVRLTEKFIKAQPTPDIQIQEATQFIQKTIVQATQLISEDFKLDEIIAVAGTPTALAVAHVGKFDPELVDGFQLTQENLQQWLNRLTNANVQEKIEMGIPEGRADVILIGVIILLETLKQFKLNHLTVSTRGVRYGVALEMDRRYNSHSTK